MKKRCFKCKKNKLLKFFYKHPDMSDGHINKCKSCSREYSIKNRNSKIEYYREYDRLRSKLDHRKDSNKQYRIRNHEKLKILKDNWVKKNRNLNRQYKRNWAKNNPEKIKKINHNYIVNNPEKYKAHYNVGNAIRSGKLKRKPCEICGNMLSQAHHDDYSRPLSVTWLCATHHAQIHKENR